MRYLAIFVVACSGGSFDVPAVDFDGIQCGTITMAQDAYTIELRDGECSRAIVPPELRADVSLSSDGDCPEESCHVGTPASPTRFWYTSRVTNENARSVLDAVEIGTTADGACSLLCENP